MPLRPRRDRDRERDAADAEIQAAYPDDEDGHAPARYVSPGSHAYTGWHDDEGSDDEDHHESAWAPFEEEGFFDDEPRRRRPVRRALGCLIPLLLLVGVAGGGYAVYQHLLDNWGSPSCQVAANGHDYQSDPDQTQSASTIVAVGVYKKGVPTRAATVAVTTAIQESKLRNLSYGDLDSLGLFQQRQSQGWGTPSQLKDPVYASGSFYNALLRVPGWESMAIGDAAQAVQRSGFPDAYAEHETQGRVLTSVMTGATHEGIGCRLDPAKENGSPAQVVRQLQNESGMQARAANGSVSYPAQSPDRAAAVAAWAIAHADTDNITAVTVGDRAWERHRGRAGWKWTNAPRPTASSTQVRIDVETGK